MVRGIAKFLMIFASIMAAAQPVEAPSEGPYPMEVAGAALERLLTAEDITALEITDHLAEAARALNQDPSAEALKLKQNLGILVGHLGTLQGRELKHIQNVYFREFYRGLMFSSNIPSVQAVSVTKYNSSLANWTANILVDMYFKLFADEINLHYAVTDAEPSPYFSRAFFDLSRLDCAKEASTLPPVLGERLRPFCESYRRELSNVAFTPRNDFKQVVFKADKALKFAVEKSNEIRRTMRDMSAQKTYLDSSGMIANDRVAKPFMQMKSCLATFFAGSDSLNPLLRKAFKPYLDVHKGPYTSNLLPIYSPIDQRIYDVRNLMTQTPDEAAFTLSIKLLSEKNKLIEQSRAHRLALIEDLKKLDQLMSYSDKLEASLPAALGREVRPLQIRIDNVEHKLEKFAVRILSQYPMSAGIFWPRMSDQERQETFWMLEDASKYFDEQKHHFANESLLATMLLFGVLLVPGGWVVTIGGVVVRLGVALAYSIVGVQMLITSKFIGSMAELKKRAQGEAIFPHKNPYLEVKSKDIEKALQFGYLSMALIVIGESLGFMKVGEGVISHSATKISHGIKYLIARWSARNGSLQLSTLEAVRTRIAYLATKIPAHISFSAGTKGQAQAYENFATVLRALERPGVPIFSSTREGYKKAYELVRILEKDSLFQARIAEALAQITREFDRRMFLESAIQVTVRDSAIAASLNASNAVFKTMVLRSVDRMFRTYQVTGRINLNLMNLNPEFRREFISGSGALQAAIRDFATGAPVLPAKHGPYLASLLKNLVRFKYDEAARITQESLTSSAAGQTPVIRAMSESAIRENSVVLEKIAMDPRMQELFFKRSASSSLSSHLEIHHEFFLDKAIRVTETISHNLGSAASAYSAQKAAATKVMIESNSFQVTTEAEILAINESIGNLILRNSTVGAASKEFFNPENIRDCSIH